MKKPGRPKLPKKQVKTQLTIRLHPDLRKRLDKQTDNASAYIAELLEENLK